MGRIENLKRVLVHTMCQQIDTHFIGYEFYYEPVADEVIRLFKAAGWKPPKDNDKPRPNTRATK